ncbi:xanthine dehydrogenase family protein molybdopterin-binding subunit [Candidatus Phyllobacterium onerii]|uniref:xanthine dehydrogenase family protein molybdopterin-binding subunit n=1 Tax=Candidatus Phyllobacterium onerii TaxID=3020828 RepID=UPI00232CA98D|nr:molybdopterin cofactor-binding domain-containing protein [Phyllobacterium sp. IY22]
MFETLTTRRDFLRTGTGLVVSFALAPAVFGAAEASISKVNPKPTDLDHVDSFLAVGTDGTVTVYSGKVDLGTGVKTALSQMVADELDIGFQQVILITGDTMTTPDQGPTYGSSSIEMGGFEIRKAAATARKALLDMAAQKLHVEPASLTVSGGRISSGNRTVTYAELVGGKSFSIGVDSNAAFKAPSALTLIGTSVKRVDIPDKCTGAFTYMQDVRREGMLHARVIRPPAMGAELVGFDDAEAKSVPSFLATVRQSNFLAVVSSTEWGAIKATAAVRANWSGWEGLPEQAKLFDAVRATKSIKEDITSSVGDVQAALKTAATHLDATYDFAAHTHGSIGPSCAVAEIVDGKLTCWTASQSTHALRLQLATMLAIPPENVRCIYMDGAGCYGRNGHEDAASDAALISSKVGGKPVRVQWMRADEHVWDPKGPPTLLDMKGGLDGNGEIVAWSSSLFTPATMGTNVPLLTGMLANSPSTGGIVPGGVTADLAIPYDIANVHTVAHRLESTPFRPAWIRSPGRMQNTFANESFLDELLASASLDPMSYRLEHINDPRGEELLTRLAKLSGWDERPSPRKSTGDVCQGRGLAYVHYDLTRAWVGVVAEVEVVRSKGTIRVLRLFAVQDCGQIINPDGVRNQIEGNLVQTTSRTLMEEVTFDRSTVTSTDWASYPIITFPDVPEIVVELIDRPEEKSFGSGEPSAAVVPAAISNAVFDATGARIRSVPMTPAKVWAAIGDH